MKGRFNFFAEQERSKRRHEDAVVGLYIGRVGFFFVTAYGLGI